MRAIRATVIVKSSDFLSGTGACANTELQTRAQAIRLPHLQRMDPSLVSIRMFRKFGAAYYIIFARLARQVTKSRR